MNTRNTPSAAVTRGPWRKSTRSGQYSDNCVEVAFAPQSVAVRDSKDPSGPILLVTAEEWRSFVRATRAGRFDLA